MVETPHIGDTVTHVMYEDRTFVIIDIKGIVATVKDSAGMERVFDLLHLRKTK